MIIKVEELNKVEPSYKYRDKSDLALEVLLSEGHMRAIFYQIWEYVEDYKLNQWLEDEGYLLIKKEK